MLTAIFTSYSGIWYHFYESVCFCFTTYSLVFIIKINVSNIFIKSKIGVSWLITNFRRKFCLWNSMRQENIFFLIKRNKNSFSGSSVICFILLQLYVIQNRQNLSIKYLCHRNVQEIIKFLTEKTPHCTS